MLGIEITIKHPDGTTTKLNVANGSTVTIDNSLFKKPGVGRCDAGHRWVAEWGERLLGFDFV